MRVSVKKLLLYFVLLLFLITAGLFLGTYLAISQLPLVADPVEFTQRYDYRGRQSTESLGLNIAFTGRELLSPYFPYKIIDGTYTNPSE
jgi:hypothetical protein